jgi:hypothetical protein
MGCYNSIVINAPANNVWEVLKKFHDISWGKNVVTKLDIIGDKKEGEIGAKRILNDAFHETLVSVDDQSMNFKYSIDDGPGPVSRENVTNYIGDVRVFSVSADNSSFVIWSSKWSSANDESVADLCNPIYHALLQELKGHFA